MKRLFQVHFGRFGENSSQYLHFREIFMLENLFVDPVFQVGMPDVNVFAAAPFCTAESKFYRRFFVHNKFIGLHCSVPEFIKNTA